MTLIARRSLLTGLVATLAAPAIVRAASLMPVRGIVMPHIIIDNIGDTWLELGPCHGYRRGGEVAIWQRNLTHSELLQLNDYSRREYGPGVWSPRPLGSPQAWFVEEG